MHYFQEKNYRVGGRAADQSKPWILSKL